MAVVRLDFGHRTLGRVLVHLTFSLSRFVFLVCLAPSRLGSPLSWSFVCPPPHPVALLFPFSVVAFRAPPLSLAFFCFRPRVPWALALCVVCFVGLALLGFPCALASFVLPAWPLAALWWLPPPSSPSCVPQFLLLPLSALRLLFFFLLLSAPLLFLAIFGF